MISLRFVALILSCLLFANALSEPDSGRKKQAQAVSKEVYDLILHAHGMGLSEADIDPQNLGYESSSFQFCFAEAKVRYDTDDERALALLACRKRHSDNKSAMSYNDLKQFIESLGLSPLDISADNLGFESESFFECLAKSDKAFPAHDERAIAHYACTFRHPNRNVSIDRPRNAT